MIHSYHNDRIILHMRDIDLQKSADSNDKILPIEVLNPHQTAKLYTFKIREPSRDLATFVDYYWIMRWDRSGQPPFVAEVIPSPYTNLTFMPEGARITGVTTGKYTYKLEGIGAIVGVKFKPGGLHPFYTKSLHKLTDKFEAADLIFAEATEAYNKNILSLPDDKAIQAIEKLLQAKKPEADKTLELITNILMYLDQTSQPSLPLVARQFGLSERRLQELFRQYVGVGIKWIIIRARLIKAAELAASLENPNWTSIAHDLGYGDQSHFINDFKRIIGKTPAQYAAEINT